MSYHLIDAPISIASSLDEIDGWLDYLRSLPQDDAGVKFAIKTATRIRKTAAKYQNSDTA